MENFSRSTEIETIPGDFLAIAPDLDNMRKVSGDLADGGEYTESFGLSTLTGKPLNLGSDAIEMLYATVYLQASKIT